MSKLTEEYIDNMVIQSKKLDIEENVTEKIKLHSELVKQKDEIITKIKDLIAYIDKSDNIQSAPSTPSTSPVNSESDETEIYDIHTLIAEADTLNEIECLTDRVCTYKQMVKKINLACNSVKREMNVQHFG
jgi:hypothetical protein